MKGLLDPPCIDRPSFLWFKRRHHEPLKRLWTNVGSVLHVAEDSPTSASRVEHFVACVCKHCGQPYITRYDWSPMGRIDWRPLDEISIDHANRCAEEAFEEYKRNALSNVSEVN